MDATSITTQHQLAWFPKSTTLFNRTLGLQLGKSSINVKDGRLYLLVLPARDGSDSKRQARIPLGLYDVPSDLKVAEKRRAVLQRQVDTGTFDWDDWREATKGTTWRQAIDQLYRKRVVYGRTGESTWRVYRAE